MMSVHPSGYYAWRAKPLSTRAKSDQRLSGLIKQSWLESGGVYGYRMITEDLRDLGESCAIYDSLIACNDIAVTESGKSLGIVLP